MGQRLGQAKHLKSQLILLSLLLLSSCSWLSSRKTLFGDDREKPKDRPVSQAQYDDLMRKYEELSRKYHAVAHEGDKEQKSMVDSLKEVKPADKANLSQTVDLFEQMEKEEKGKPLEITPAVNAPVSDRAMNGEVESLNRALAFLEQSKFDNAMGILKKLENSNVKQVRVRAKFYIGELLFAQKEYDLAMQVFEQIVDAHAFSGLVLKSLGRLIVCSEKLKIKTKQDHYYSILHSFFES